MTPSLEVENPNSQDFERRQLLLEHSPKGKKAFNESQLQHCFPQSHHADLPLSLESQEIISRLGDNFVDVLGGYNINSSELCKEQLPNATQFFGTESFPNGGGNGNPVITPDSFIDDLPMDIFDNIELLPSPSKWWHVDQNSLLCKKKNC